jgi:PAS domain-containing protein
MKTSWRNAGLIVCLEAERHIRDGEATSRRISDTAIDGMSMNEIATGNHIDVNESFAQSSGSTREELLGSCSWNLGLWPDEDDWRYSVDTRDILGEIRRLASAPYQGTLVQGITTAIIRFLNPEAAMGNL